MYRSEVLGLLNQKDVNKKVTLSGWADTIRDHGGMLFIDLRDYSGKIQLVVHPGAAYDIAQKI